MATMMAMIGRQKKGSLGIDRQRMLDWDLKGRDITDPRVLAAMAEE